MVLQAARDPRGRVCVTRLARLQQSLHFGDHGIQPRRRQGLGQLPVYVGDGADLERRPFAQSRSTCANCAAVSPMLSFLGFQRLQQGLLLQDGGRLQLRGERRLGVFSLDN